MSLRDAAKVTVGLAAALVVGVGGGAALGHVVDSGSGVADVPPGQHVEVKVDAQPPVVVFLGDSYVNGSANVPAGDTFSAQCARQLGWTYYPAGMGGIGYTTGSKLTGGRPIPTYVAGIARDYRPDTIVVEGGLNELYADPAKVHADAALTYRKLREAFPHVRLVVIGPFIKWKHAPDYAAAVRDAVKRAAAEAHADFIDPIAEGWMSDPKRFIDTDTIHLTAAGLAAYSQRCAADLRRLS